MQDFLFSRFSIFTNCHHKSQFPTWLKLGTQYRVHRPCSRTVYTATRVSKITVILDTRVHGLCTWVVGTELYCRHLWYHFYYGVLRSRYAHYIFVLFLSSFFSSPNLSGRRLDVCHTSTNTRCGLSANLECRSEMCCTRIAENTECKQDAKIGYLRPIVQLYDTRVHGLCTWVVGTELYCFTTMSSQLRHVSTIRKKTC